MQDHIQRQLPARLRELVHEIETAAHAEITLRQAPDRHGPFMCAEITFGNPDRMDVCYRESIAETFPQYPEPYACFCHELLHLRRVFVEKVPTVYRIEGIEDGPGVFSAIGLELALEHFVIDPLVKQFGIKEYPLRFIVPEAWSTVPLKPWRNEYLQRWLCMEAWIKTSYTEHIGTKKRAEHVMERYGMLADASRLTDQMRRLAASPDPARAKEGMILAACEAFHIPVAKVMLLDPVRRVYVSLNQIAER